MFSRGEREKARMVAETESYRRMAIDLEVDNRLQSQDFDLAVVGRHLLTSNDRYQFSSAQLLKARNNYLLANSVAESVNADGNRESAQAVSATTEFVKSAYHTAKDSLDTADLTISQIGFSATPSDIGQLTDNTLSWPPKSEISPSFVAGMISGCNNAWASAHHDYEATIASHLVPNDFKRQLTLLITPLMTGIDSRRAAIERVTDTGGLTASTPIAILQELYEDARSISEAIERITILLTMPRLHNGIFRLKEPYDETQPEKKSFNPASLGLPAVQETISKAQPLKPFSTDILGTPVVAPQAQEPAPSSRPFNPSSLGADEQKATREFDPSTLDSNDKK